MTTQMQQMNDRIIHGTRVVQRGPNMQQFPRDEAAREAMRNIGLRVADLHFDPRRL